MTEQQQKGLPFVSPPVAKVVSCIYFVIGTIVCLAFYVTKYAI